jgi:hypothetical protein
MAAPYRWDGARVGKCYNNVRELIRRHGGEICYGWALADYGPHRRSGQRLPPPLYRRWANHAVWRDAEGRLWEVTPTAIIDDYSQVGILPTEFVPDPGAVFEVRSETDWVAGHSRYVPLRPEGIPVTKILTEAQHATGTARHGLIQEALTALVSLGFEPREWRLETIGERTGSIWLIAD